MTMGLHIFMHTHANARMSTNLNPRSGMPMFACPVVFMRTRFPFLTFTGLCWGLFFSFFRSSWLMLALLGSSPALCMSSQFQAISQISRFPFQC